MGSNKYGQLGTNTTSDIVDFPNPVYFSEDVVITGGDAGGFHTIFVTKEGDVWAAGRNNYGQHGDNVVREDILGPEKIEGLSGIVAAACGYGFSLFLTEDGNVLAAGLNNMGQLGVGDRAPRNEKVAVTLPGQVAAVAAGYDFSYFLLDNGEVYATGNGIGGQLGTGKKQIVATPVKVLDDILAIDAGDSHGVFLTIDGTVFATGANFDGQLGSGSASLTRSLTPIEVFRGMSFISAGGDCSTWGEWPDENGTEECTLYGTGSNRRGQLGLGETVNIQSSATEISAEDGNVAFCWGALEDTHGMFLTGDGAVYASGSNDRGELGLGLLDSVFTPVKMFELTSTRTTTSVTEISTITETTTDLTTATSSEAPVVPPVIVTTTTTEVATTSTVTLTRGSSSDDSPFGAIWVYIGTAVLVVLTIVYTLASPRRVADQDVELGRP